jgi:anti-anti-sigma regulatory factor
MDFDYKLFSKGVVTIVSFKGKMTKEARERILACQDELLKGPAEIVVLFFRDVSCVDSTVHRELTQIQQELRRKSLKLFVTGLSSPIKQTLEEKGVVRSSEIKGGLEEILLTAV